MMSVLLALLTSASTSTTASDLFSDEPIALFEDSVESPSETRVSASTRFSTLVAVDTGFEERAEHVGRLELSALLRLDAELSQTTSALVAPRFRYVAGVDRDVEGRQSLILEAPEAFLRFDWGPLKLRLGNLVFGWGTSDLLGPSDVMNPPDLRSSFLGDRDSGKIPVLAADAQLSFGPWSLRAVVQPVFVSSRFYLEGWDTSFSTAALSAGMSLPSVARILSPGAADRTLDQALVINRPTDGPENASLGVRLTGTLQGLDLGMTFFHGFDPIPALAIHPDVSILATKLLDSISSGTPLEITDPEFLGAIGRVRDAQEAGIPLLTGEFRRRTLLGLDAALAVDPVVLKVDVAYTLKKVLYTQQVLPVSHPWLSAVVGLELAHGEDFILDLEPFVWVVPSVPRQHRLLFLEAREPLSDDPASRTVVVPGVALAARASVGDWKFELGALSTVTRGDFVLSPRVSYRLFEGQTLTGGATVLGGKADGFGGVYSHNDEVFLQYALGL